MTWLLLPKRTVLSLQGDEREREWLAQQLPDEIQSHFALVTDRSQLIGRVDTLSPTVRLLMLWRDSELAPISVQNEPFVSIWSATEESTIWSMPASARAEALERIAQLATRSWDNLAFPNHWRPKRIEGLQSIFAGDR